MLKSIYNKIIFTRTNKMIIDTRNLLTKYENSTIEYKSLKKAIGKSADLKDLAKTCVCLANTQGGYLFIGIEDKDKLPPSEQKINQEEMNDVIKKLRSLTDSVGLVNPELITHENGGEYFVIQIYPSMKTIAITSEGRVYVRVGDECTAIKGEETHKISS
jgi:ATP-dependent DNA helicase RecG